MSETPQYDANTSDSEQEEYSEITPDFQPVLTHEQHSQHHSTHQYHQDPPQQPFVRSKFQASDANTILKDDYVIIGLKHNENLIISGQFKLKVQRGAIKVNDVILHSSAPELTFMSPISSSIPLISATQLTNMALINDTRTEENECFFNSHYKSVVKLTSMFSGLETVGEFASEFKTIFGDNTQSNQLFKNYSFDIVLDSTNLVSVLNTKNWNRLVSDLSNLYKNGELFRIMVIGNKNSGKSTLTKLLLTSFLNEVSDQSVNVIDLDPGQPEFSQIDCVSLNKFRTLENLILGSNQLSLSNSEFSLNHFIGFNSSKDQPKRYVELAGKLMDLYNKEGLLQNESLLINTPGWLKGFGLEIMKELIDTIKPTHLIYLNSGKSQDFTSSLNLKLDASIEIIPVAGNYFNNSLSKFSAINTRSLKLLNYFHQTNYLKFDYSSPLIFKPPFQISYGLELHDGIKAVHFLENKISIKDLKNSLDGTIVGVNLLPKALKFTPKQLIITKTEFQDISDHLTFKSLGLIHSINEVKGIFNIYLPSYKAEEINQLLEHHFIVITRGKTETPTVEFASAKITSQFRKNSPFVSFNQTSGLDKTWRVRKNVQRKGR